MDARAHTASSPGWGDGPFRRLQEADLAACLALDRRALGGQWSAEQWRRELQEPARIVLGLGPNPRLLAAACGWLVVDELHIILVAVDPRQRRRGLGRALLEALLEQGRVAGARHATLEVAAGNGAARALYAGCGFQEAGVRRGYYRNGDDALIQWCRLSP